MGFVCPSSHTRDKFKDTENEYIRANDDRRSPGSMYTICLIDSNSLKSPNKWGKRGTKMSPFADGKTCLDAFQWEAPSDLATSVAKPGFEFMESGSHVTTTAKSQNHITPSLRQGLYLMSKRLARIATLSLNIKEGMTKYPFYGEETHWEDLTVKTQDQINTEEEKKAFSWRLGP